MKELNEEFEAPAKAPLLGQEALTFVRELGICIGGQCPHGPGGCDPRCTALRVWVEKEVEGRTDPSWR